jgi:hypothetical protein
LFVFSSPALLKDLNNNQIIRSLKAKVRVLADNLAGFMLRDDLGRA